MQYIQCDYSLDAVSMISLLLNYDIPDFALIYISSSIKHAHLGTSQIYLF
jgi:hypothetical protein